MFFLCGFINLWASDAPTPSLRAQTTPQVLLDRLKCCPPQDLDSAKLLANQIIGQNLVLFPDLVDILLARLKTRLSPIDSSLAEMFICVYMDLLPTMAVEMCGVKLDTELLLCFADHPRIFGNLYAFSAYDLTAWMGDPEDLYFYFAAHLIEPQHEMTDFDFADSIIAALTRAGPNERRQLEHDLSLTPAFQQFMRLAPTSASTGPKKKDEEDLYNQFKKDLRIPQGSGLESAVLRQARRGNKPPIGQIWVVVDHIISYLTGQTRALQYVSPTENSVSDEEKQRRTYWMMMVREARLFQSLQTRDPVWQKARYAEEKREFTGDSSMFPNFERWAEVRGLNGQNQAETIPDFLRNDPLLLARLAKQK
jgi:hypothetical protein